MPEELYRRCPACLGADAATRCPTCAGERYVAAGVTLRDVERLAGKGRNRWRIRFGTLMLLVVIAGLASYIVADLWHRAEDARRLALEQDRAIAEAQQAEARAAQAQAQIPVPAGPTQ